MNRDTLRKSLRQPYNRENWTNLVRSVFGQHVRLNSEAQGLPTEDESIKSIAQLGDVTLDDGRNLAVIEVEVDDNINLLRNRVNLRNRVAKFIDQDKAHGVLAVFSSSHPEYRFSFTAKETIFDEEVGMVEKETSTKRFTYVLGPGETCTTAAARFEALSQKTEELKLDDVIEAFSVEKLNKEFFNKYRDHYDRFCNYLLSEDQLNATHQLFEIEKASTAAQQSRNEKPVRDFVKRLLGRIVFLHFLQKKGWMGCPADSDAWSGGDPKFLRTYFEQTEEKATFHSERLVPLFFGALNTPDRPHDVFEPTGTRIPYLNGGLFESWITDEAAIDFPADYFADLLEFFGQYNFTIDENDPDEHEVGIDPEMLGHIFENLLEDNKDKGAYYTPKAIVHYMCQQSLIYYLLTHLEDTETSRAAIEYLVRNKQTGESTDHGKYIRTNAARIEELLDEVKICDPAIGSGAFPIGLLQEIFWLKLTLDLTLNEPAQLAKVKRSIIQNSIYGVDKDAGAVSIARLRFWLALVVDEDQPRPLPNLDYKIMQGDSLLESFEGVSLENFDAENMGGVTISPKDQVEMDFASGQMQLTAEEKANRISELTKAYFTEANPETKQQIHKEIDQFILNHIDYNLSIEEDKWENELLEHRREIRRKEEQLATFKPKPKTVKRMAWLEQSIAGISLKKTRLETLEQKSERPYFLWHLFFQDIFAKGGFDIVIANPPYVRQEIIKDYKPLLEAEGYECFKGTADLFVYFYERSVNMLNENGVLTYITSNKYYRSGYGEKLRKFLAEKLEIREMLDFGDAPVFDAIAYASIMIGAKNEVSSSHTLKTWTWQRGEKINRIAQVMGEKAFWLQQKNLTPDSWKLERPEVFSLLEKLKGNAIPLGQYVEDKYYRGILTGLNDAFVVDRTTRDRLVAEDPNSAQLLKAFLRGRDVKSWKSNPQDLWLIFTRRGTDIDSYPAIKRHLAQFKERLMPKPKGWPSGKEWNGRKAGSYEWYEIQDNIAYWQEFEALKVLIPAIQLRPMAYADNESFYCNNKASIFASKDAYFLAAVINSQTSFWFCRLNFATKQNENFDFEPRYSSQLLIPEASENEKSKLSSLTRQASRSEGPALAEIENEINQIVYRLFDLTTEEIRLIESTINKDSQPSIQGEHGKTKQKDAFFRRIKQLASEHPYISFDAIKQTVRAEKLLENEVTLKDYLGEAVEKKIIHSAGKGWYSSLSECVQLDTEPASSLVEIVEKAFPLLDFSTWSTTQLNPWMHHLLAQPVHFLNAPADTLETIGETLRDEGWEVSIDPPESAARKAIRPGQKMVVLRPSLSRQPAPDGRQARIEQIIVDLLVENARCGLMDDQEATDAVGRILRTHLIQVSGMQRYAGTRTPVVSNQINDLLSSLKAPQ